MKTSVMLYVSSALVGLLLFSATQAAVKECWGPWVNATRPTDANNRTDKEAVPSGTKVPAECQGKPLKVQCEDDKKEPFTGSPDKSASHYNVSCDNNGLTCKPFKDFKQSNYTCPDFSIQVGCDCAVSSGQTTLPSGPTGNSPTTPGGNNGGSDVRINFNLYLLLLVMVVALRAEWQK